MTDTMTRDFKQRYKRQQLVTQLGNDAQQKLSNAHVVIVGAGGLGSPLSMYLTGAGVGNITLIDDDVVSLSNLHRQILFKETDISQPKVEVAKDQLAQRNSNININAVNDKLSIDNVDTLLSAATVVVDAADSFLVSYILSDACLAQRVPLVSASVLTTHGYLGVFCGTAAKPAPSVRAIFPTPSAQAANCDTAGVTGPSVGIIASYQAQEVIKVIIGDDSQLLGKLMTLDLWNYRQQIIDFNDAPEPDDIAAFVSLDAIPEQTLLLDVRTQLEHQQQPLPRSAINIPLAELAERLVELDRQQAISCICKSGQRALNAAHVLLTAGFTNITVTSQ